MTRMIFVNLPVVDRDVAVAFYEAIGFTLNPAFSDETTACMVMSDAIYVMLLSHDRWHGFTAKPIPAPGTSEVMLAYSCESRAEVDSLLAQVTAAGGKPDVNPMQDHGFMYSRSFEDPDGHIWEPFWMDPAAVPADDAQG